MESHSLQIIVIIELAPCEMDKGWLAGLTLCEHFHSLCSLASFTSVSAGPTVRVLQCATAAIAKPCGNAAFVRSYASRTGRSMPVDGISTRCNRRAGQAKKRCDGACESVKQA